MKNPSATDLFKNQYFEIILFTAKNLTKKNITTYSEYSILIDDCLDVTQMNGNLNEHWV